MAEDDIPSGEIPNLGVYEGGELTTFYKDRDAIVGGTSNPYSDDAPFRFLYGIDDDFDTNSSEDCSDTRALYGGDSKDFALGTDFSSSSASERGSTKSFSGTDLTS